MGSKKNPKLIPTAFKSSLDSLNTDLDYKLNQVLVNRYTGPDASLPSHSDDENDINSISSIFTVSLTVLVLLLNHLEFLKSAKIMKYLKLMLYLKMKMMQLSFQQYFTISVVINPILTTLLLILKH